MMKERKCHFVVLEDNRKNKMVMRSCNRCNRSKRKNVEKSTRQTQYLIIIQLYNIIIIVILHITTQRQTNKSLNICVMSTRNGRK